MRLPLLHQLAIAPLFTLMSKQTTTGEAILAHYKEIYHQYKATGKVADNVSAKELEQALEVMAILKGKYGECSCVPSEEAMCKLLEEAQAKGKRVGYISHGKPKTIEAAGGMGEVALPYSCDNTGRIGLL